MEPSASSAPRAPTRSSQKQQNSSGNLSMSSLRCKHIMTTHPNLEQPSLSLVSLLFSHALESLVSHTQYESKSHCLISPSGIEHDRSRNRSRSNLPPLLQHPPWRLHNPPHRHSLSTMATLQRCYKFPQCRWRLLCLPRAVSFNQFGRLLYCA